MSELAPGEVARQSPAKSLFEIAPSYAALDEPAYRCKINSPSASAEYFARFHRPLVEEAKQQDQDRIRVLSIACGHAHEFDFLKDDSRLTLVGIDISGPTLEDARSRFADSKAEVLFVAEDVEFTSIADNSFDAAIGVNAVVYKPVATLKTLSQCLKPRARAVVNFRISKNQRNREFFEFYLKRACRVSTGVIRVAGQMVEVDVLDYRNCSDQVYRNLDRQIYFQHIEDVELLASACQLRIQSHATFEFVSAVGIASEFDVFVFEKTTSISTRPASP